MADVRTKVEDVNLPANSGATPGTTTTVVAAVAGREFRTFTITLAKATGANTSLVEIGVVGTKTIKFSMSASNPTVHAVFPEGLYTAQNTAITARVMANGGDVAVRCAVTYMEVLPAA